MYTKFAHEYIAIKNFNLINYKIMKKIILIISVLFVVANIYSQPQMKVHVYGGYNVPLGNLGGNSKYNTATLPDVYLYMKSGFNAGADIKYFPGKKRNIGLLLIAAYNGYSTGDLTGNAFTDGKRTLNDIRIGIGAEYDFMPLKKVNPFFGIDLTGNFLSGKFTPSATNSVEQTMNSASRFGFAIGAGLDIAVGKSWGFVIGAKYDMINLIGKKAYDSTAIPAANTFDLYDKSFTVGTTTVNELNMMDIQFYGGVAFFFGQP